MANGTIAFDTLSTSGQISGTAKSVDTDYLASGSAKAWVNLNGTGTIAIRESFNVTSVTDHATGDHTVTINNDFSNANYSAVGCCLAGTGSGNNGQVVSSFGTAGGAPAGSLRFAVQYSSSQAKNDVDGISIQFHGDIA